MFLRASSHSPRDSLPVKQAQPVETADEHDDAEQNYRPKSPEFWTIMTGMYLSVFLVALDRTIIATAIPRITDDFNSIQDIGWYGSANMLTAACFCPIFGRIYQLYSTKPVVVFSIVTFGVGSTICGAAPDSTAFIIGRAVAGSGSAGIVSGGMMIIVPLVPLRKRPVFTSMFGMAFGLSSVLGPIIGGTLTDQVTWRWCFYLNLPIGGFILLAVILFLHIESPKSEKLGILLQLKRMDPLGIFFLIPSMVCLILALEWGGSTYSWSEPKIIGLLVTFSVLFIAFITVEGLMSDIAMAPTRVVLNRSVAGSMAFTFLLAGSLMSVIYYLSVWFQVAKDESAIHAGISTIPWVLALIIMGILGAICTEKSGYYVPAMLLSPILCSIGAGLLSTLSPKSGHNAWIGYQVLYAFGVGIGFQTGNLPAQYVLPRADVPLGMALMFFMQQLGGSVFLAVSQNVFSSKLVDSLSGIGGLDAQAIVNTGATTLRTIVAPDQVEIVVYAYSHALTRVFVLAAILGACMILGSLAVQWKRIKGHSEAKGGSGSPNPVSEDENGDEKIQVRGTSYFYFSDNVEVGCQGDHIPVP